MIYKNFNKLKMSVLNAIIENTVEIGHKMPFNDNSDIENSITIYTSDQFYQFEKISVNLWHLTRETNDDENIMSTLEMYDFILEINNEIEVIDIHYSDTNIMFFIDNNKWKKSESHDGCINFKLYDIDE